MLVPGDQLYLLISDSPCVELVLLRSQQCLDRAPLVHGAIALRYLVEGQCEIENFAGIDHALQDEVDEVWQVSALTPSSSAWARRNR